MRSVKYELSGRQRPQSPARVLGLRLLRFKQGALYCVRGYLSTGSTGGPCRPPVGAFHGLKRKNVETFYKRAVMGVYPSAVDIVPWINLRTRFARPLPRLRPVSASAPRAIRQKHPVFMTRSGGQKVFRECPASNSMPCARRGLESARWKPSPGVDRVPRTTSGMALEGHKYLGRQGVKEAPAI